MKNNLILVFFALIFSCANVVSADNASKKIPPKKTLDNLSVRTQTLENQIQLLQNQVNQMKDKEAKPIMQSNKYYSTLVELYAHGPAVVTSPVFGLRANEDEVSPELMVNLSGINRDLLTLKLRQKMDNYAHAHGIPIPSAPIIVLSGGIEGQVFYKAPPDRGHNAKTEIGLSRVELDIIGEVGPWITSSMIIAYDDKSGDNIHDNNITKVNNSRLQIDRAWLTIGQLNKSPVYFSIGQLYAPFGNYANYGISTPSIQTLGKTKDRMVVLGYDYGGFNAQVYSFAGETKTSSDESKMTKITKHSGVDLNYKYENEKFGVHAGAGIIGNLAESEGMQEKIFGQSTGVKGGSDNETLQSRVPGYNAHIKFDVYNFNLLAEYIAATKAFDPTDITFNDHGAKPQALNVEAAYSFKIKGKLNTVFAGYGLTSQALALGLPKQNLMTGYNIALMNNILAAIEYRHDINYGWNDVGGGRGITTPIKVTGRHHNIVTAKIEAYF